MIYEIINKKKQELGLTNAQLAEKSGVTLSTLDKITSGANSNPKLSTLQAIARVIGCTLDDFDENRSSSLPQDALDIAQKYILLSERSKEFVRIVIEHELKPNIEKEDERALTSEEIDWIVKERIRVAIEESEKKESAQSEDGAPLHA